MSGVGCPPLTIDFSTGFYFHGEGAGLLFVGARFPPRSAVGEIVRDLVLGREPFVDIASLSVERFSNAASRPEHNVV